SSDDDSFGVMHRLTADFLRTILPEEQDSLVQIASRAVLQAMEQDACKDPKQWPLMNLMRPHAEILFEKTSEDPLSDLGLRIGTLAGAQGDYASAKKFGERVLELRTKILREGHPSTLASMNNLGIWLYFQGDFAGARSLQEKVLEAHKKLLGE